MFRKRFQVEREVNFLNHDIEYLQKFIANKQTII